MPLAPLVRPPGQNWTGLGWTGPCRPPLSLARLARSGDHVAFAVASPSRWASASSGAALVTNRSASLHLTLLYNSIRGPPSIASFAAQIDTSMDLEFWWLGRVQLRRCSTVHLGLGLVLVALLPPLPPLLRPWASTCRIFPHGSSRCHLYVVANDEKLASLPFT
jgi:hypothetical protein